MSTIRYAEDRSLLSGTRESIAMKAIVCLTCMLLQPSLAQALELPSGQLLEQKPRGWREPHQPQGEELAHYQSQPHAPPRAEAKAYNAGTAVRDPALETLMLQAKAYRLLGALTDDELERVRQKDVLRLASRGQDSIPQNNPVLARIAEHAGITVSGWHEKAPSRRAGLSCLVHARRTVA